MPQDDTSLQTGRTCHYQGKYATVVILTFKFKHVEAACNIVSQHLAKHMVSLADAAVKKYNAPRAKTGEKKKGEAISRESRAKLFFKVSRVEKVMRSQSGLYVSEEAAIAMTAAVQNIIASLIEIAIRKSIDLKKKSIGLRSITLALAEDDNLNHLFRDIDFGVAGGIDERLVPKKRKRSEGEVEAPKKKKPKSAKKGKTPKSAKKPKSGKPKSAKKSKKN